MTTLDRIRRPRLPRALRLSVLAASAFNLAATAAVGVAGILIARSLGPSVRGEYAAVMTWFSFVLALGGFGQSAATTYFVAREPDRARAYVAVSRNLMVVFGVVTVAIGMLATPLLAPNTDAAAAYRIMFAACLAAFVGLSYVSALQASRLAHWNLARLAQPLSYLAIVIGLYVAGWLTLMTALAAFLVTTVAQTLVAYAICGWNGLTGGRPDPDLVRPLGRYGAGQLAAMIPMVLVSRLDLLVLSLAVDPAVLGNYAVAASLTTLAIPVTAGVGYVAFPRIAARRGLRSATAPKQRAAVVVTGVFAGVLMLLLLASGPWLIPRLFGDGFQDTFVFMLLLTPAGICRACQQVCGDLLRGHGRPFAVARAHGAGAAFMVLLLVALVPVLGALGAAIAASASSVAALVLLFRSLDRTLSHRQRGAATP